MKIIDSVSGKPLQGPPTFKDLKQGEPFEAGLVSYMKVQADQYGNGRAVDLRDGTHVLFSPDHAIRPLVNAVFAKGL